MKGLRLVLSLARLILQKPTYESPQCSCEIRNSKFKIQLRNSKFNFEIQNSVFFNQSNVVTFSRISIITNGEWPTITRWLFLCPLCPFFLVVEGRMSKGPTTAEEVKGLKWLQSVVHVLWNINCYITISGVVWCFVLAVYLKQNDLLIVMLSSFLFYALVFRWLFPCLSLSNSAGV